MICGHKKVDCFAYGVYGRCDALWDTGFKKNKECPFYKPYAQQRAENIAAFEKLERNGRNDLIEKYMNQDKRNKSVIALGD